MTTLRFVRAVVLVGLSLSVFATPASASDLGIRVVLSGEIAPGVYGEVELGNSRPRVFYPEPVVVHEVHDRAPVYLHVPPGHAKKWGKHCHRYNACAVPVYFVASREYRYEPEYTHAHYVNVNVDVRVEDDGDDDQRGHPGRGKGKGKGKGRGKNKD